MKEETIYKGHTAITHNDVEIQASENGDVMIFYDGDPIFMLSWLELVKIYKKATHKRNEA